MHPLLIWQEVLRVRAEHPDDCQAILNDRVKGQLKVTRAFGAGFLKKVGWFCNLTVFSIFLEIYFLFGIYALLSLFHLSQHISYLLILSMKLGISTNRKDRSFFQLVIHDICIHSGIYICDYILSLSMYVEIGGGWDIWFLYKSLSSDKSSFYFLFSPSWEKNCCLCGLSYLSYSLIATNLR